MIQPNSLVLYKNRPAKVVHREDKVLIHLQEGETLSVRLKDVTLLHPGPMAGFEELAPIVGEVETAWEILQDAHAQGITYDLRTLAELIFDEFTPASAWATWELWADGLYFSGAMDEIVPRTQAEVEKTVRDRQAKVERASAWSAFLDRVQHGTYDPEQDVAFLREVEDLAWGRRTDSKVMNALGRAESPERAHALLLSLGYWDELINPHPVRLELSLEPPAVELPTLTMEDRVDLTHLQSFAIDDQGNQDPDDALSIEDDMLWVHVADVAALIPPDTPADREARGRGATLYLPEGVVPMLPRIAVETLGLGLDNISPALSFGLTVSSTGEIEELKITPSWVRVQRMTYVQAEELIDTEPFKTICLLGRVYLERRRKNGAMLIDMPEVHIRFSDGRVELQPLLELQSRVMVREAMLMTGEASAQFARQHKLPFPFVSQDPLDQVARSRDSLSISSEEPSLALFFATLRTAKPSQVRGQPAPHAGVGLPVYSRVTSPLRRYLDLVAHQQLRAFLSQRAILDEGAIMERVGASEAVTRAVKRAESLARRHWTLVYFHQHPGWQGEGVLVEKRGPRARLLIPALAFETQLHLREDYPLNSTFHLTLKSVNLADQEAYFEADFKA